MFKKGDLVIGEIKKYNWGWTDRGATDATGDFEYDIIYNKGIVSGTQTKNSQGELLYLVKLINGDQRYFYEDRLVLDKAEIRSNKLKQLGI